MKTIKKWTAGNSAILARIKREMNAKIYKGCMARMNADGPEAVREYLRTFFRPECYSSADRMIDGE